MGNIFSGVRTVIRKPNVLLSICLVACALILLIVVAGDNSDSRRVSRETGPEKTLAAASWSIISSPNNSINSHTLNSVSTVSANDVWAAGSYSPSSGGSQTLIEHWNGAEWSTIASPNVTTDDNYLNSIDALSSNNVWAVGYRSNTDTGTHVLIEHWDGTQWNMTTGLSQTDGLLYGVSGVSANDVWAVGYKSNGNTIETFVMHWDGSTWSVAQSPNITGALTNKLLAVTAISANDVWAVGEYSSGGLAIQTLVTHWDGTQWNIVSSPNISLGDENHLLGISAVSPNDIWAVGYYTNTSGAFKTITQHYDGTIWNLVASPNTGQAGSLFHGVSAISANDVWAVGYYPNGIAGNFTLIEHWDGSEWVISQSQNVSGSLDDKLFGVAKVSAGDIWAVGNYTSSGTGSRTLIEHSVITPIPTNTVTPLPTSSNSILNVPLLKQGILPFTDNNPPWEGAEYDHGNSQNLWCGTKMVDCGCAVTSIAMLLRYYNIVNPSDGSVTTPSAVNDYFRRNAQCGLGICASLGYFNGDVRWDAVNNYAAEAFTNFGTQKILYDGGGAYNFSTVKTDITDEKPVIIGVPGHWVIATGNSGNTFNINDPFFNRTLLSDPAYDNTGVQGIRRYKKTNSDFSSIDVAVLAPAQVIITAPNGQKTGFDTGSASVIANIPNSEYFFDKALVDDTGQRPAPPPNAGVHWAIIRTPQAGKYSIEVISAANLLYDFAVYGSDRNANTKFKLFEGRSARTRVTYSFDYSPVPGETTISQQVRLDVKPEGNSDTINPKSNGVLRVAVLSVETFDPAQITLSSVKLGSNKASPNKNTQLKDISGDNNPDLIMFFSTAQIGIKEGDTTVCLTGKIISGFDIRGCSTIRTTSSK